MGNAPPTEISLALVVAGYVGLLAAVVVWMAVAARARRGLPVIPYVWRRPVPWNAIHVIAILLLYLGLAVASQRSAIWLFDLPVVDAPAAVQPDKPHLVVTLLRESHTPATLLLCFISVVVVAPIVEEFVFRVVLQGWLEAVEMRLRRQIPALRRLIPGAAPVVLISLLFGGMHYRIGNAQPDPRVIAHLMAGDTAARVVTLLLAIGLLRWGAGAKAEDLGLVREKLFPDARLGILAFLGIGVLIYSLKIFLARFLPQNVADPLVMFVFAAILGTLYCRTHRIAAAIVLHLVLNLTSLTMEWFRLAG